MKWKRDRIKRFSSIKKITKRHYFLKYKFIYVNWRLITLQYCSGRDLLELNT